MKEVTVLLMQAKQAREEALNTISGKGLLHEKVKTLTARLRKEREEKLTLKKRQAEVFAQAVALRRENKELKERMASEREQWQRHVRRLKESHMENMRHLREEIGEESSHAVEGLRRLNQFGERVMSELTGLQEHLSLVRHRDSVSDLAPLARAGAPTDDPNLLLPTESSREVECSADQ